MGGGTFETHIVLTEATDEAFDQASLPGLETQSGDDQERESVEGRWLRRDTKQFPLTSFPVSQAYLTLHAY